MDRTVAPTLFRSNHAWKLFSCRVAIFILRESGGRYEPPRLPIPLQGRGASLLDQVVCKFFLLFASFRADLLRSNLL